MFTRLSCLGRVAVIVLPLLLLPVAGWGGKAPPKKTSPPSQQGLVLSSGDTPLSLYFKGGVVMHLIALCSVLALALFLERSVNLRKGKIISSQFLEEIRAPWYRREVQQAIAVCKSHDIAMSRTLRAGLLRFNQGPKEVEHAIKDAGQREGTLLRKNLGVLAFLANMAPMLGLFGTVLGMIKSFDAIAIHGQQGNVEFVAAGIAEALITTAWGLMVGLPALGLYYYFRRKVELRVTEMEAVCVGFLEDLAVEQERVPPKVQEREPALAAARPRPAAARPGPATGRLNRSEKEWDGDPSFKPLSSE
ncbi:MAG: MotA/TolQ/ExbB proton channel family protein [Candidatus Methylomirabilales bacterium]